MNSFQSTAQTIISSAQSNINNAIQIGWGVTGIILIVAIVRFVISLAD